MNLKLPTSIYNCFIVLGLLGSLSSCITNKQVQYFQKNDVNPENVTYNSTVRSYEVKEFEYKLQPHDVIHLRVESITEPEFDFFNSNRPESNNMVQLQGGAGAIIGELIDEEGMVHVKGVGGVEVGGKTIFEAQNYLEEKMRESGLLEPVVNIRLLNFRFTVLGEVNSEGTIVSFNNKVELTEAIGLAGGLGELADRSKIKLIRKIDGEIQVSYINLLDETYFEQDFVYVHQNDVIVVPPVKQRPFRLYFGQNAGLVLTSLSTLLLIVNLIR